MPLPINLVAVCSPSQDHLRKRFEHTFKDTDIAVVVEAVADLGEGDGSFQTESWYNALRAKIAVILRWIGALKSGNGLLVASDIDIQFFRRIRPVIEAVFANSEVPDIAFQRELPGRSDTMEALQ